MAQAPPRRRSSSSPADGARPGGETQRSNAAAGPLRTDANPPRKPAGRRTLGPRALLLLTFGCGVGLGYGLAGPLPRLLDMVGAHLQHASPSIRSLAAPLGLDERRILVLGTDQISGSTDVMVTVQVKDGTTQLTQVPRDTFIESEHYGVQKANALYAIGGVDVAKQEIGSLLSTPIDRYLLVNLDAVQRLAEELGGVEVDVPKRMYYTDTRQDLYIDLYPGPQVLQGRDLEGFLRYRNDELGDLGRMERQKLVLREIFRKLAQPGTVARLPALLQLAGRDITTDLTPVELGALLAALSSTNLSTERLAGRLYWHEELSYWMPDVNNRHDGQETRESASFH